MQDAYVTSNTQYDIAGHPEFAWYDAERLQTARDILADPRRWTRRWPARDINGHEVSALSDSAVCWDSLGALQVARVTSTYWIYAAMKVLGYTGLLSQFNDAPTTSHETILRVFDTAVRLAEDADLARRSAMH